MKWKSTLLKNQSANWKRKGCGKDGVENAFISWLKVACDKDIPHNGPLLMHKTEDLSKKGREDFKATSAWFYKLCQKETSDTWKLMVSKAKPVIKMHIVGYKKSGLV